MPVKDLVGLFEPLPSEPDHEFELEARKAGPSTPKQLGARFIKHRQPHRDLPSPTTEGRINAEGVPEGTTRAFQFIANSQDDAHTAAVEGDVTEYLISDKAESSLPDSLRGRKHIYPPAHGTTGTVPKRNPRHTINSTHKPVPATTLFGRRAAPLALPKLDAHLSKLEPWKAADEGMLPPMDRLVKSGRSLEDLEYNRPVPPVWKDRNLLTGATLNIIFDILSSSFVETYYSLGGLINTVQIFALILSSIGTSLRFPKSYALTAILGSA